MSFVTVTSSLLSLSPRVWEEQDSLHARTHLLAQALTLFAFARRVVVDRRRGTVVIERRRLWVLRRRRVYRLEEFSHIDYGYGAVGTSWGWTDDGIGRHDQVERFHVDLVRKDDDQPVRLLSFVGEGASATGAVGVLLGDDSVVDYSGNQADTSRTYVELLQEYTGLPLSRPLSVTHLADERGRHWWCQACARPSPPGKPRCQYCGGPVDIEPPG